MITTYLYWTYRNPNYTSPPTVLFPPPIIDFNRLLTVFQAWTSINTTVIHRTSSPVHDRASTWPCRATAWTSRTRRTSASAPYCKRTMLDYHGIILIGQNSEQNGTIYHELNFVLVNNCIFIRPLEVIAQTLFSRNSSPERNSKLIVLDSKKCNKWPSIYSSPPDLFISIQSQIDAANSQRETVYIFNLYRVNLYL